MESELAQNFTYFSLIICISIVATFLEITLTFPGEEFKELPKWQLERVHGIIDIEGWEDLSNHLIQACRETITGQVSPFYQIHCLGPFLAAPVNNCLKSTSESLDGDKYVGLSD